MSGLTVTFKKRRKKARKASKKSVPTIRAASAENARMETEKDDVEEVVIVRPDRKERKKKERMKNAVATMMKKTSSRRDVELSATREEETDKMETAPRTTSSVFARKTREAHDEKALPKVRDVLKRLREDVNRQRDRTKKRRDRLLACRDERTGLRDETSATLAVARTKLNRILSDRWNSLDPYETTQCVGLFERCKRCAGLVSQEGDNDDEIKKTISHVLARLDADVSSVCSSIDRDLKETQTSETAAIPGLERFSNLTLLIRSVWAWNEHVNESELKVRSDRLMACAADVLRRVWASWCSDRDRENGFDVSARTRIVRLLRLCVNNLPDMRYAVTHLRPFVLLASDEWRQQKIDEQNELMLQDEKNIRNTYNEALKPLCRSLGIEGW